MSRRFPFHALFVVQQNKIDQYMNWYSSQARKRWNVLITPEQHRAALESAPLQSTQNGQETHFHTVMILRPDQDKNIKLNTPNHADVYEVNVYGQNELPTVAEVLDDLNLEPVPEEEP